LILLFLLWLLFHHLVLHVQEELWENQDQHSISQCWWGDRQPIFFLPISENLDQNIWKSEREKREMNRKTNARGRRTSSWSSDGSRDDFEVVGCFLGHFNEFSMRGVSLNDLLKLFHCIIVLQQSSAPLFDRFSPFVFSF